MDKQPSERTEQVEKLTPLLAVDDLFCERDERVLFQNLSFRLAEGQVLQIKGGNGSGKTTCLLYTSPSPRDATLSRMPSSA